MLRAQCQSRPETSSREKNDYLLGAGRGTERGTERGRNACGMRFRRTRVEWTPEVRSRDMGTSDWDVAP